MDLDRGGYLILHVLLMVTVQLEQGSAGFVESPSSITVEYDSGLYRTVEFGCQHERAGAILWKLNGSSSIQDYDGVMASSILENGILVGTLRVPVIPAYNRTEVVCSAFVNGSFVDTPAAVLTITTGFLSTRPITTPRVTTSSPTSTPPSTTTTVTTVDTPSTVDFDLAPSPLTVAVEEGVASFYCQHTDCNSIDWKLNGTFYNRITSPNISRDEQQVGAGAKRYSISIATALEYNMSRVECVAYFSSGSQLTSPVVMLLIQDVPGRVKNAICKRNYSSGAHLITDWDPLPSLDLTNTEPDIVYRVQWRRVTCGQNVSMGEETVTGTHTSRIVHQPYDIYEVVITPRNNVTSARYGESAVMREKFLSLESRLFNLSRNSFMYFKDNSPVPSYYTMLLKSLDRTQSDSTVNINVQRDGESVELRLEEQLPSKTLWNVSVLAHNCEADSVLEGYELSTHDIQSVETHSPQPGTIRVTSSFIEGANATDALLVVYPVSNNSNVQYIIGSPTEGSMDVTLHVLTGGDYKVSVFALENGRPFRRAVTLPRHVHVDGPNEQELQQHSLINYEVQSTSTGVCITCTFLESSTTDCVAVVHQRISQLNSSGLMQATSSPDLVTLHLAVLRESTWGTIRLESLQSHKE